MCVGSCTTYTKCGHNKYQTEATCPGGMNPEGNCVHGIFAIAWQRWSYTPNLCVNCYRRHVDDVIARHKKMIAAVDEEIRVLIWKRRAVSDDATREQMQKERSRLEVKRGELIDSRYDELEEFRIQQGVWGDAGPYKGYRPFGTMEKAETV
ncbi:MAG: hypothetical protein Q9180_005371 [Flavoplaca navasiana]